MAFEVPSARRRQHVLVDGDDTLWENNRFFAHEIDRFCRLVARPPSVSAGAVEAALEQIQHENCHSYGYGIDVFVRSLHDCAVRVRGAPVDDGLRAALARTRDRLRSSPVVVLDGVAPALVALAERHEVVLMTKGDAEDQLRKLRDSGLGPCFSDVVVVAQKTAVTYDAVVEQRGWDCDATWMIGNSPRSDVRPALEAGLRAVLVPHPATSYLEFDDLSDMAGRYVEVRTFSEAAKVP